MRSSSSSELYVPKKGDVVWIDFNPQSGREQAGRRPALVISSTMYNRRVRLALVCPITTKLDIGKIENRAGAIANGNISQ